jgi:hypothetical protein
LKQERGSALKKYNTGLKKKYNTGLNKYNIVRLEKIQQGLSSEGSIGIEWRTEGLGRKLVIYEYHIALDTHFQSVQLIPVRCRI